MYCYETWGANKGTYWPKKSTSRKVVSQRALFFIHRTALGTYPWKATTPISIVETSRLSLKCILGKKDPQSGCRSVCQSHFNPPLPVKCGRRMSGYITNISNSHSHAPCEGGHVFAGIPAPPLIISIDTSPHGRGLYCFSSALSLYCFQLVLYVWKGTFW